MWSVSRFLVRCRPEASILLDVVAQRSRAAMIPSRPCRFLSTQLPRMDYYGGGKLGGKDGGSQSSSLPPKLEKLTQNPPWAAGATPLPKRHSRKEAPPVCKEDWTAWNDSVQKFTEAPLGQLYSYQHYSAQHFPPPTGEGREIAWNVAYPTVQRVEYWMRGYAARIPGTITWKEQQRAILVAANDDEYVDLLEHVPIPALNASEAVKILQQMEALVNRLVAEGDAYMHVRADRCNELHQNFLKERHLKSEDEIIESLYSGKEEYDEEGEKDMVSGEADESDIGVMDLNNASVYKLTQEKDKDAAGTPKNVHDQLEAGLRQQTLEERAEEDDNEEDSGAEDEEEEEDEDEHLDPIQKQHKLYCNQFASPGPTMTMFMIWLDALAVCAPHAHAGTPLAELCHPLNVEQVFVKMYRRHQHDGGDVKNQCEYTVADLVAFNSVIRACSHLPKPGSGTSPDKELRDSAVLVAFSVFDALCHSKHITWNAATFRNMLKLVDLFFAPGKDIKGNVSVALLAQAQKDGVVNESVLRQFLACHQPTNTPVHEDYLDRENLRPNADGSLNIREQWEENHMKRRWHPADDTY